MKLDNTRIPPEEPNDPPLDYHQVRMGECMVDNTIWVYGDNVSIYGLACEHTIEDQIIWKGEHGSVTFIQMELPYVRCTVLLFVVLSFYDGSNFGDVWIHIFKSPVTHHPSPSQLMIYYIRCLFFHSILLIFFIHTNTRIFLIRNILTQDIMFTKMLTIIREEVLVFTQTLPRLLCLPIVA